MLRFFTRKAGFTLVELMTTIVIIGILAVVGLPAYKQYVLQARMAEAYVTMEAIKKAQLSHYHENGNFINLTPGYYGLRGVKFDLATVMAGDGGLQNILDTASLMGNVIGYGRSQNYFGYNSVAGFTNAAGVNHLAIYSGKIPAFVAGAIPYSPFRSAGGGVASRCEETIDLAAFGIQQIPNEHWLVIVAGSDMSSEIPNRCTRVYQAIRSYNGISTGPLVTVDLGQ